ncbi:aspartate/glutamate racemase family protein [Naasia sp. SYSU D00948]|uniref:aspartate/glutamate racemase family protein n=1 Tax=Naasia sp. SYSU D00948 TaxID=2817379 RepID=UPI001B3156CD|nr:aspartate/glutamate racemase family protein [Naasia sp. SYSU D00948]
MHITVINPNTSAAMTSRIGAAARAAAGPGVEVAAVHPTMGPASIESHYEEALAVPGVLEQIALGDARGTDGYVLACFGDPGLDAAREFASAPVLGIAEAAMHAATMVGRSFSVVTTLTRTVGRAEDLVQRYGFERACRSILASDIPVLDLEDDRVQEELTALSRHAVHHDGADVIVLGCAGMASLQAAIADAVGVPVVDGVVAAVGFVTALARAGVTTSRRSEYARPPRKEMSGLLAGFALA